MNEIFLFTDGSVNARSKIGYGAYLATSEIGLSLESLKSLVKLRRFEHTSSTKLELQTLLWALNDIRSPNKKIIVYTDSQNSIGLNVRRERLEKNDFLSKKGKRLSNHNLYIEFFSLTENLDCQFFKVRGHQSLNKKDDIDRIFMLVDKASRNALRENTQ